LLRFVTGRRKLFWNRNCVALGLAAGFIEPLESTSIHLVMSGLYKLLEHFPDLDFAQSNIDAYNTEIGREAEGIRDFIVLHYCATARDDTPFWRDCRRIVLPDSLQARIDLYAQTGRIRPQPGELFNDLSWFYVLEGMGIRPRVYDPLADVVRGEDLSKIFAALADATAAGLRNAPAHDSYFAAGGAVQSMARA
jgi:tryptophan halogenase